MACQRIYDKFQTEITVSCGVTVNHHACVSRIGSTQLVYKLESISSEIVSGFVGVFFSDVLK